MVQFISLLYSANCVLDLQCGPHEFPTNAIYTAPIFDHSRKTKLEKGR